MNQRRKKDPLLFTQPTHYTPTLLLARPTYFTKRTPYSRHCLDLFEPTLKINQSCHTRYFKVIFMIPFLIKYPRRRHGCSVFWIDRKGMVKGAGKGG